MHTAPLTTARDNLREIVDTVMETGEAYTITRHGHPSAVILAYDEYEALIETLNILSDDDAMEGIAAARAEFDA
ncbi:MAG: type II toxin-antitoxin system Phd/YefM family antitoxin [Candidatus Nanopelagicales bacterium]